MNYGSRWSHGYEPARGLQGGAGRGFGGLRGLLLVPLVMGGEAAGSVCDMPGNLCMRREL